MVDMEQGSVAAVTVVVFGLAVTVWGIWATIVAFVGGTVPLLGRQLEGSFGTGMVWLLVVWPFAELLAYWAALLVSAPFEVALERRSEG